MAANWFPVSERDLATTICALFNPLGNAVGQVVPPFVVTAAPSDDALADDLGGLRAGEVAPDMQRLLVGTAAVLGLVFLWNLTVFRSHPPSPPSQSTFDRLQAAEAARYAPGAPHHPNSPQPLTHNVRTTVTS